MSTTDDEENLFAELEAEIENDDDAVVREIGLAKLKQQLAQVQQMKSNHYGTYTEIGEEKQVVQITASEKRVVIHFYHSKFKRCEIMDKHLALLARKYQTTRFSRVFVENIPWLVERLSIKVLPCVISFVDGVTKDRLVGFEELGNDDAFTTATLELRLRVSGVIDRPEQGRDLLYKVASTSKKEEDDEFDL